MALFQSRERDSLIWKKNGLKNLAKSLNRFNPANGIH